jgi:hypothetical protein
MLSVMKEEVVNNVKEDICYEGLRGRSYTVPNAAQSMSSGESFLSHR